MAAAQAAPSACPRARVPAGSWARRSGGGLGGEVGCPRGPRSGRGVTPAPRAQAKSGNCVIGGPGPCGPHPALRAAPRQKERTGSLQVLPDERAEGRGLGSTPKSVGRR